MAEEKTIAKLGIDTSSAEKKLAALNNALDLKNLKNAITEIGKLEVALTKLPSGTNLFDEMFRQLQKHTAQYEQLLDRALGSNFTKEKDINEIIQKQEATQDKVLLKYAEQLDKLNKIAKAEEDAARAAERRQSAHMLGSNMAELDKILEKITQFEIRKTKLAPDSKEYAELSRQLDGLKAKYEDIAGLVERSTALEGKEFQHIVEKRAESEDKIALAKAKQEDAAEKLRKSEEGTRAIQQQQKQLVDQIFKRMVQMVALRALRTMWREAMQYASEYYDKLNEIRLVTGKTQEEANALGQQYRDMAEELKVTSSSLVSSVASLYRQGLGDEEVTGRLKQITEFATVAGIEIDEATRLMTSSINNFTEAGETGGQAAQRIADTYANYGDRVATTAEDIATAMTKTAASASNVGVTLERTAAYAATILAVTQDEAESIGNALNTIISRYSRITKTGFGRSFEFDGEVVNVNDVATALSQAAGISIFNYDTGEFRDFGTVLDELAAKWDTLGQRERNYIATQLAGTRQYNRVLTLMQNYDMAMGLLETSYTDTGTVAQKYAIWTESVAAAQNNLKNSLEDLYSILSGEVLKGFYNSMAAIVDVFTNGIKAIGTWPVTITATVSALGLLVLAVSKVVAGIKVLIGVITVLKGTMASISANGILGGLGATGGSIGALLSNGGLASMLTGIAGTVAAITLVVGGVVSIIKSVQKARQEALQAFDDTSAASVSTVGSLNTYITELETIGKKSGYTADELAKMNKMRQAIVQIAPDVAAMYGLETESVLDQADAYDRLANAMRTASLISIRDAFVSAAANSGTIQSALSRDSNNSYFSYADYQKYGAQEVSSNIYSTRDYLEQEIARMRQVSTVDSAYNQELAALVSQKAEIDSQIAEYESTLRAEFDRAKDAYIRLLLKYSDDMDLDTYAARYQYLSNLFSFADISTIQEMTPTIKDSITEAYDALLGEDTLIEEANKLIAEYSSDMSDAALTAWTNAAENLQDRFVDLANGDTQKAIMYSENNPIAVFLRSQAEGVDIASEEFGEAIEDAASNVEAAASEFDKAIAKMISKRDAANAATNGYNDQWMSMLEALTSMPAAGQKNRIAEGTYGDFLGVASTMMDPQVIKQWFEELYATNEAIATGMLEKFPALAELVFSGDEATVEQLKAALEQWQNQLDDATQSIIAAYEKKQAQNNPLLLTDFLIDWGVDGFKAAWEALSSEQQQYLADASDAIGAAAKKMQEGIEDTREEWNLFNKDVQAFNLKEHESLGEVFTGVADAIEHAADGGMEWNKSYAGLTKQSRELAKAQRDLLIVQGKVDATIDEQSKAFSDLASYVGMSAEDLRGEGGLASAEAYVMSQTDALHSSIVYLNQTLFNMVGIRMDPSNLTSSMDAVAATANNTAIHIAQLISALLSLDGTSQSLTGYGGKGVSKGSDKSSAKASSGGGGGGGGGSKKSYSEKLISRMEEGLSLSSHARELAQQAQSYYEVRRELQGVIRYQEVERRLIEEENVTLEGYLKSLEEAMKKYGKNSEELQKLQAQHQEYSLKLLKNKTDVESLTKAIKEQNDKIRQMEIDLRNTVLQAIEDREAREERMLNGRIKMENEMLGLLKKRYEKERDEILETVKVRKQALEDEKDAIDELLNARKKQEESDERLKEIAELEAKISRISADPTRQKEAASLREQLAKLRNDLAWEEAENEAEAQKKALDDQITNIEDYKQYVEDYYEELLNNPRKMIEEVSGLLEASDAEILEWLKANSEDFQLATDATRQSMLDGWNSTLLDMRGSIETYWEEVEAIIAKGDEYIIEFLKNNSASYAEAGKLQAQAYVDEWLDQLEALHLAYKYIGGDIEAFDYVDTSSISSTSTSGGGGSGGGGSNKTGSGTKSSGGNDKTGAANTIRNKLNSVIKGGGSTSYGGGKNNAMLRFANGGLDKYTGLAVLHGTPAEPEAVLNPSQTKLFQGLVAALEAIPRISVPGFAGINSGAFAGGTSVGDVTINVNVNSLDKDTDVEEAADKLGNAFLNRIQRGMSVSGVRFGNA